MNYSKIYEGLGQLTIRPFDLDTDCEFLHEWVNQEYAIFWGLQNSTLEDVHHEYQKLMEPEHYDVFVGTLDGRPIFVMERYDPSQDIIAEFYLPNNQDIGVHIIVAPATSPKINDFTWHVFLAIMEFVFTDEQVERIIVEPDIRNKKMISLCERIGFVTKQVIELPHKSAQLAFLEREKFQEIQSTGIIIKRSKMNQIDNAVTPQQAIEHIQPKTWEIATRLLIRKALCEFGHEYLIKPAITYTLPNGWSDYILEADDTSIEYHFTAKTLALNHFLIDLSSIYKTIMGDKVPLDAIKFIKEFKIQLGITDQMLPTYLEEIISTLHGSAYKLTKGNLTAKELAYADFQTIEQSMTEGHPCFVANNGRIGFDSSDYRAYAPETGNSFSLMWLAGHKDYTKYAGTADLSYETTMQQELGQTAIDQFNQQIIDKGFDPKNYLFIPIHPWQWFNKLAQVYTPEIAKGNVICLGYGADQYLAQQSIRTMYNTSSPKKFYVKSALSILNMGFMRGLPYYYLGTAPKMAVWLEELLYNDPFIANNGFRMLSEVASVSYVNPYFEEFGPHNDYNKMLASLWRESPTQHVKENQQLMTMAALVHVDDDQKALLPELIKASGKSTEVWLSHYFDAYLIPLLHCFYKHDLVFMPHGENIIIVLEDQLPKHIFLKDITEEAVILNKDFEIPEALDRMIADVPEDVKLLSIFIDVFDDFFRFMVHIFEEQTEFTEGEFWTVLAQRIQAYQDQFPELEDKFEQYDLFADSFKLSCLNRLQINNNRQMIDLDDPVALLQFTAALDNPIAKHKRIKEPNLQ